MTGFDQLEHELVAAASRAHPQEGPIPRRSRVGTFVVAASVIGTLALAVLLLTQLKGHPGPPHRTQPADSRGLTTTPASKLTPCSLFRRPFLPPRSDTSAPPDPRFTALLGVLRRPASPADAGPYAQCAALAATGSTDSSVNTRYIRYLAPGITGGKVFIVPVSGNPTEGRLAQVPVAAAVCFINVGYFGTIQGVGTCVMLSELQHGFSTRHAFLLGSAEIVNTPLEQQPLKAAGFPPALRQGSIVSAIVPNNVSKIIVRYRGETPTTVRVHDNYAQYHTRHSAPVAVRASLTLLDKNGRVLDVITPG